MPTTTLSDFISTNIESILKAWEDFAKGIIAAHQLDPTTARDHAKGILLAIVSDMDKPQTTDEQLKKSKGRGQQNAAESPAELHGAARLSLGFDIAEEVSEFRALRASVLRLWSESSATALQDDVDGLIRFNEAVDKVLAESVARYATERARTTRMLDTLLSSSPDLHFVFALDGRFIYANAAMSGLYGCSPSEMVGTSFSDRCSSAAELASQLDQVIASKTPYRGDVPRTLPSGEVATYEYILMPVMNAAGDVEAIAGTARNMSEREQLENNLRREKYISDTIIESAPGAFFMIDEQTNLIKWNKYLNKQTGLSDEQLRGRSILTTIDERDRQVAAAKFLTAFSTGYAHMEVRVPTTDHGNKLVLKTARRFIVDGIPYVAGYCIDVTDRKRTEDALAKEKLFSDSLTESAPGAFYVVDIEGNYVRWNSYLKRLTGLSDRELQQRHSLMTFAEEDRPRAAATMKAAFEDGYAQAELHVITRDRGVRLFFMTARRFQVDDVSYLIGVGIDTTEWLAKMKELERVAWTDPLTQVASRGHFLEQARQEFARCRRYGHPLSLWMLDIDHFKAVNDAYGHHAGDVALQSLVSTSQKALRDWDILGRMGGEEFAVLLPETETAQAQLVAERLRQAVATTGVAIEDGKSVRLTVSVGISEVRAEDADFDALLDRADKALYEAKRTGRDKVCLAEPLVAA